MRRILLALLASGTASAAVVDTVDREGVDAPGFSVADGKVASGPLAGLPLEDLVQVSFAPAPAPKGRVEVRLSAGDVLWGDPVAAEGEGFRLQTPTLGLLTFRLEQVASVLFAGGLPGPALAALQDRMAADRPDMKHDLCYLAAGDRVKLYVRSVDAVAVKGEDEQGRAYAFPVAEVRAVSLLPAGDAPAASGLRCRLGLKDGSLLLGELRSLDAGKAVLAHPVLGELAIPADRLASLEPLSGRVIPLSSLDPVEAVERPYVFDPAHPESGTVFRWRRDRQVMDGRPLSLRGRTYATGLGAHSYCELSYDLGGGYERFRADVGIDDSAAGGGAVEAVVRVDGKERFRARLTGKDAPQRVEVDCRGASRLTLVVEFGEGREVLDRAAWAGAILVRRR